MVPPPLTVPLNHTTVVLGMSVTSNLNTGCTSGVVSVPVCGALGMRMTGSTCCGDVARMLKPELLPLSACTANTYASPGAQ